MSTALAVSQLPWWAWGIAGWAVTLTLFLIGWARFRRGSFDGIEAGR